MTTAQYSPQKTARMAGVLYLITAITAPFVLFYIPSQTRVPGDAAATAAKMLENETLLRSGLVIGLFGTMIFLVVAILLYRLFKPVDAHLARLMVVGVVIQIPIGFVLDTFSIASLLILKGEALKELTELERQRMAFLMLKLGSYGTKLLQLLWGLWLLPLGMLVWKSGILPRWLGGFVFLNGVAYVATSIAYIVQPSLELPIQQYTFPLLFGELAFMIGLIVKAKKFPAAEVNA